MSTVIANQRLQKFGKMFNCQELQGSSRTYRVSKEDRLEQEIAPQQFSPSHYYGQIMLETPDKTSTIVVNVVDGNLKIDTLLVL